MDPLVSHLNILLANMYVLYYRMHAGHWNVVGSNFPQYHSFLGELYDEVIDRVDDIAEEVRKLEGFPPQELRALLELSNIPDASARETSNVEEMMADIEEANIAVIVHLREGITLADKSEQPATSNFLQDLLSAHQKIAWKLKSTLTYVA
jgi:starvation-inducible DNA-binding protein